MGPKLCEGREHRTATKDDGKNNDDESDNNAKEEDGTTSEEWEQILKDSANLPNDPTEKKPKELPISHLWKPYHRSESARALGLVAQCYASAGAAVTAEGLFQSSLDASSSYPFGQDLQKSADGVNIMVEKGVSLTSPNLGLIARDVRLWYAMLCDNWEKRKGDADRIRLDALKIEDEGVLKGYLRDENDVKKTASSLESSLWLFSPNDFER